MRISFQTYRTIKQTLAHALHTRRNSHQEQHLNTLAALICGIVGAKHVQFAQIADHVPLRGRKNESIITRFRRWVKPDAVTPEALWLPFARALVEQVAHSPLTIVLDGTTAGRGCVVLGTFEKLTSPKTRWLALGGCRQTIFRDPAGA